MLRLDGHRRPLRSLAFSPDGRLLASAGDDLVTLLWDLSKASVAHSFPKVRAGGGVVAFSPDGTRLALTSNHIPPYLNWSDQGLVFWNPKTRQVTESTRTRAPSYGSLLDLAFAPIRPAVALVSQSNNANRLFYLDPDLPSSTFVFQNPGWEELRCLAIAPDGESIAVGSSEGTVRVWGVSNGHLLRQIHRSSRVNDLVYTLDGTAILLAVEDAILWWGLSGGKVRKRDASRTSRAVGADSRRSMAVERGVGSQGPHLAFGARGPVAELDLELGAITALAVSPDGMTAVAGGENGIALFDLEF